MVILGPVLHYRRFTQVSSRLLMPVHVETLVRNLIHCLSTSGGRRVPRLFGSVIHGTFLNSLLHFDYIFIGLSSTGTK